MMKKYFGIIIITLMLLITFKGFCADLIEVEYSPVQPTFLYGTEVAFNTSIRNLTADTLRVRGFGGTSIYEIGYGEKTNFKDMDISTNPFRILAPFEEFKYLHSRRHVGMSKDAYRYRDRNRDPKYRTFFPLGRFKFHGKVIVQYPGRDDVHQVEYPECEFEVVLPEGNEKEVLSLYIKGYEHYDMDSDDHSKMIAAYEDILQNYAESEYVHSAFISLMGSYHLHYGYYESAHIGIDWANKYADRYPDHYGDGLDRAISLISDYYRVMNDKVGLLQRFDELNHQFSGTRIVERISRWYSDIEKGTPLQFNRANELEDK